MHLIANKDYVIRALEKATGTILLPERDATEYFDTIFDTLTAETAWTFFGLVVEYEKEIKTKEASQDNDSGTISKR